MTQNEYSTSRRKFQQLTIEKRAQIEIMLRMKVPKSQIARMVGIAHTRLYNELACGNVVQLDSELRQYTRYFNDVGQRVYKAHWQNIRRPLKLAKAHDFIHFSSIRFNPSS